jgi:tRNA A37 threonylcarbamoyladenosine dehydratase
VGRPKVEACAAHFADFAPFSTFEAVDRLYEAAAAEDVLAGRPDFVVDAIDDIKSVTLDFAARLHSPTRARSVLPR